MKTCILFLIAVLIIMPASAIDVIIQDGHDAEVTAVQTDTNGQYIVSGSGDAALKVWSLATGMLLHTLTGHTDSITAVAVDNNGLYAASGSRDKTIRTWSLQNGKAGVSIPCPAVPLQVFYDATGRQLISSHQDNKIRIWDSGSGTLIKSITVESGKSKMYRSIPALAIDPGNSFLACAGSTGDEADDPAPLIHILHLQTGKQLTTLKGHTGKINVIVINGTGEFLFSAGEDRSIMMWRCSQWEPVKTLTGFKSGITALAADNEGAWVAAADHEGVLNIADIMAGKIGLSAGTGSSRINTIVFSPDNQLIITGETDNTIKLRDRITAMPLEILEKSVDKCLSPVVLPGAKQLATGMDTGEIKIWNLSTGYLDRVFPAHNGAVKALLFNSRDNTLVSAGSDALIKIWDGGKNTLLKTFTGHTKDVNGISIDRTGRYLASGSDDETIRIWDIQTGKPVKTINNFMWVFGPVEQPHFVAGRAESALPETPDYRQEKKSTLPGAVRGRYWINDVRYDTGSDDLITAGYDGVKIWNVESGRVKSTLFSGFSPVNTVAFDSARKYTVSGDIKGQIVIWKFSTPTVVKKIPDAHAGAVNRLVISDDSRFIFSAGDDNLVKIWRITDGGLVSSLPGHVNGVNTLVLLDETGNRLFSAGRDGSLVYRNREAQYRLTWINRNTDWLIFSPEGFFNSTSTGVRLAGIADPPQVYGLEPAALKNNRPDKILEQLFIRNQPYIDYYTAICRERLGRAAVDETKLLAAEAVPPPAPPISGTVVNGKFLDITFEITDSGFRYYNILLNHIPLYSFPGKGIEEQLEAQEAGELSAALPDAEPWARTATIRQRIELARGVNRVEVYCTAESGIQSLRSRYTVAYGEPVVPTLYFIGFGVSEYKDKTLNVKYSGQDIKDVADYLGSLKASGTRILVKTFLNAEVDANALQKAGEFIRTAKQEAVKSECAADADKLAKEEAAGVARVDAAAASRKVQKNKQTSTYNETYKAVYDRTYRSLCNSLYQDLFKSAKKEPSADDTIILFLNGRVYRDNSTVPGRYFFPFAADTSNILHTALNLQAFTSLLDVPGVRHKMLITDFTNSVDITESMTEALSSLPSDIKARGVPSFQDAEAASRRTARTWPEDTALFFFTDPVFNGGIITLASCRWGEMSLESSRMKNGLFTEHLLRALSWKAADLDGDGLLTLQELYAALSDPVVNDSLGLQHPVLQGAGENPLFRLPAGK